MIDRKAETIVSEIVELFQRKGIQLNKLMTLASEEASVMTRRHNGVGVRLKREYSSHLTQIHCVAHYERLTETCIFITYTWIRSARHF